jgi:hypothetical protein
MVSQVADYKHRSMLFTKIQSYPEQGFSHPNHQSKAAK